MGDIASGTAYMATARLEFFERSQVALAVIEGISMLATGYLAVQGFSS
jgi:hypothetical protein